MIISVASNIQPELHVPAALATLAATFQVHAVSPFYQTPAIDRPEQSDYWNGVMAIETILRRPQVVTQLRALEAAHGRIRSDDKWAARTLDLDVVIDGGWLDDDVKRRPFLQRALADLESLPRGMQAPDAKWPVAYRFPAEPI
jgi:2-amino-4-hydroxy-6-hydroxymethyldihydropteridine diphosphokinase